MRLQAVAARRPPGWAPGARPLRFRGLGENRDKGHESGSRDQRYDNGPKADLAHDEKVDQAQAQRNRKHHGANGVNVASVPQ